MDPIRRNILATGVAAAATVAAPHVFAQQAAQGGGAFKFYEKGNVRIRYQEVGNGFPFLVTKKATSASATRRSATVSRSWSPRAGA
jgi:hypothetical protein